MKALPANPDCLMIYRGPGEGGRLRVLSDAAAQVFGRCLLVYLCPGRLDEAQKEAFCSAKAAEEGFDSAIVLPGEKNSILSTMATLRRKWGHYNGPVISVGFVAPYARMVGRSVHVWSINGIPEELLMHRDGLSERAYARTSWKVQRFVSPRPDLVVTVSGPMSELVQRRCGYGNVFAVPMTVDLDVFLHQDVGGRDAVVYSGWAAPWQNLEHVALVWAELARRDPSLRFRVISKDPRSRILGEHLPPDRVEFFRAVSHVAVAEYLRVGCLGFLLREDHLVNQAAYPTKFGEYLAAGMPVVATDMDWDIARLVRQTGAGVLLRAGASPAEHAERILEYRRTCPYSATVLAQCHAAARALDRRVWIDDLAARMSLLAKGRA